MYRFLHWLLHVCKLENIKDLAKCREARWGPMSGIPYRSHALSHGTPHVVRCWRRDPRAVTCAEPWDPISCVAGAESASMWRMGSRARDPMSCMPACVGVYVAHGIPSHLQKFLCSPVSKFPQNVPSKIKVLLLYQLILTKGESVRIAWSVCGGDDSHVDHLRR